MTKRNLKSTTFFFPEICYSSIPIPIQFYQLKLFRDLADYKKPKFSIHFLHLQTYREI